MHSGGRQFGPLSDEELQRFFKSGMVKQGDALAHAELEAPLSAANAAELMRLPAPGTGSRAGTVTSEVRHLVIQHAEPGLGWREIALWLTLLLALQFFLVPKGSLGEQHSVQKFVLAVVSHFFAIGAVCVLAPMALARVFTGRRPSATWPLLAMTLACVAQLGWWASHPEATAQPSAASFVLAPYQADPPPAAAGASEATAAASPQVRPTERSFQTPQPASESAAPAQEARAEVPNAEAADAAPTAQAANWDYWQPEADKLENQEDWNGLRNLAERWTQAQPQRAAAWTRLGMALRRLRRWDESTQANRRAVELAPNDYHALFELALNYSVNRDYSSAVGAYQRIVSLWPNDAGAWNNLGNAYSGLKQHESAVSAYQSAVKFEPGHELAWENLGLELYALNRFQESVAAYEKALALEPGNEDVKAGLQRARQR